MHIRFEACIENRIGTDLVIISWTSVYIRITRESCVNVDPGSVSLTEALHF